MPTVQTESWFRETCADLTPPQLQHARIASPLTASYAALARTTVLWDNGTVSSLLFLPTFIPTMLMFLFVEYHLRLSSRAECRNARPTVEGHKVHRRMVQVCRSHLYAGRRHRHARSVHSNYIR